MEKLVHNMVERAQRMDGTATGEHGVGVGKKVRVGSQRLCSASDPPITKR